MSRNPAVWRTAVTSVVAALVAAGILSPALGDQVNTWAGIAVVVVTALLPIVGALWGKRHTVPVVAGTPVAPVLVRDQTTGVYQQSEVIPPSQPTSFKRLATPEEIAEYRAATADLPKQQPGSLSP